MPVALAKVVIGGRSKGVDRNHVVLKRLDLSNVPIVISRKNGTPLRASWEIVNHRKGNVGGSEMEIPETFVVLATKKAMREGLNFLMAPDARRLVGPRLVGTIDLSACPNVATKYGGARPPVPQRISVSTNFLAHVPS